MSHLRMIAEFDRVCFGLVLLDCVLRVHWASSVIFNLITRVLVQSLIRHPHPALLAPGACSTLAKPAHCLETLQSHGRHK